MCISKSIHRKLFFAALWIIVALAAVFASCGDDGSSSSDSDAASDDDANDDLDDDANDDANDDADDDDDTGDADDDAHPYTPCCDVGQLDLSIDDPQLPADGPGPYQFVEMERVFTDTQRDRQISSQVLFPSHDGIDLALGDAPFPVALVVHGFSGRSFMVREYAERLASWGFIAVAPNLPDTDPTALFRINHAESARDLLFILNSICCEHDAADSEFFGLVDRSRLASVGHSMGGKLSVLAGVYDGGLSAVVGLDPVDGAGPIDFGDAERFPDVNPDLAPLLEIPTLYLGGTESGIEFLGQACAPTEDNYHQFWTNSPSPSVEVTFNGADHTDFITQLPLDPCDVGSADHERVKSLAKKYTIAFLNYHVRGWQGYIDDFAGEGIDADAQDVSWRKK